MYHYTYKDIINKLIEVGIKEGDDVFLHSNLGFFGNLKDCNSAELLCFNFFKAIKHVVGNSGTIIVPTFSYSFCHNEIYNVKTTKSNCGMLAEYIRNIPTSLRSMDPNFSISCEGYNSELYVNDPAHESFGKNSFWDRFYKRNGKIVCMNFDSGSTFVHYVERENNVSYRYNKAFNGIIDMNGHKFKDYFVHYVYDLDIPEDAAEFSRLDRICKKAGISKSVELGKGSIVSFHTIDYYNIISETLKKRPRFLTRYE